MKLLDVLIDLIGIDNTLLFLDSYGGITYTMPKGDCERARRLRSIMGNEATEKLMRHFAGEKLYIPQYQDFVSVRLYRAFVDEVSMFMADGVSKTLTLEILCPKYKISDRFAYNLLKINNITYDKLKKIGKNYNQLSFDFGENEGDCDKTGVKL